MSPGFQYVTCGSTIKLAHEATQFRLHSHKVAYGTGSHQQSVTLMSRTDDPNSLWTVLPPLNGNCARGTRLKSGRVIRLKHAATGALLHSHEFTSPLSGNQEVSAYEGESNTADHWTVVLNTGSEYWEREQSVTLKHVDTGKVRSCAGLSPGLNFSSLTLISDTPWPASHRLLITNVAWPQFLHSTGKHQFGQPIQGQREVCASAHKGAPLSGWLAVEGFYAKVEGAATGKAKAKPAQAADEEDEGNDE